VRIEERLKQAYQSTTPADPGEEGAYDRFLRRRARSAASVAAKLGLLLVLAVAVAVLAPRALTDRQQTLGGSGPVGRVVARIALADRKFQEGAGLVVGQGAVWVDGLNGIWIERVDPDSHQVRRLRRLTGRSIALADGILWSVAQRDQNPERIPVGLTGLDLGTNRVIRGANLGTVSDVAAGAGAVWVAEDGVGVTQLDPRTGQVVRRVRLRAAHVTQLAAGDGAVMGVAFTDPAVRIDPYTGRILARLPVGPATNVVIGHGSAWFLRVDGTVVRVELRSDKVVARIRALGDYPPPPPVLSSDYGPKVIAVSADAVWVADHTGAILRIDPATNRVVGKLQAFLGSPVLSLADGEGALWATTRNGEKAELARIDPAA
jgi:streptogramin lyase